MKTRVFNEEVLYADESIVKVDHQDIQQLKEQSDLNERKRIRLCAHRDIEDRIHEMLIIHTRDTYVRPHKHINKIESFHIIEGIADIIIYADDGSIEEIIPVGEYKSGRTFYYRLSDPLFHTLWIVSENLVFHETTNGPFRRSDMVFAPWSPPESDKKGVSLFMENLAKEIEAQKTDDTRE